MPRPRKKNSFTDWVNRHAPSREELLSYRLVKPFAHRIRHSSLWRFTRTSVPRGAFLGIFVGILLMIPGLQMIGVAVLAFPLRANIPVGIAMTFISNPLTTPFVLLAALWTGSRLFGLQGGNPEIYVAMLERRAPLVEWMRWIISDAAPALMSGLLVIATVGAVVGYILSSAIWDYLLRMRIRRREKRMAGD